METLTVELLPKTDSHRWDPWEIDSHRWDSEKSILIDGDPWKIDSHRWEYKGPQPPGDTAWGPGGHLFGKYTGSPPKPTKTTLHILLITTGIAAVVVVAWFLP